MIAEHKASGGCGCALCYVEPEPSGTCVQCGVDFYGSDDEPGSVLPDVDLREFCQTCAAYRQGEV